MPIYQVYLQPRGIIFRSSYSDWDKNPGGLARNAEGDSFDDSFGSRKAVLNRHPEDL